MQQEQYNSMEAIYQEKQNTSCLVSTMAECFRVYAQPVIIRRTRYDGPFFHSVHMHDFPQVWYCLKGEYLHTVGGTVYRCREGSLLTVPPGHAHGFEVSTPGTELLCLECTFYFLKKLPESVFPSAVTHMFCHAFAPWLRFAPRIYFEPEEASRGEMERLLLSLSTLDYTKAVPAEQILGSIGLLYSLPCFALSQEERQSAEKLIRSKISPLYDAVYYCHKNYIQKLSSDTAARRANMCRSDFFNAFKQLFGTTYSNYILSLRLFRGKLLLEFSSFSISYIADNLNFTDAAYMGKLFKEHYGLTMQQYRKLGEARRAIRRECLDLRLDDGFWDQLNIE